MITFCSFLLCACAAPGQVGVNTPQSKAQNYPPVIEDSPERQQAAQEAWKNFLAEFRLPDAPPDLEPVLNTPRTLPMELAGQIVLHTKAGAFGEMEAKEALRRFIERARGLLVGGAKNNQLNLKDLSLVSFSNDGNFYRAVYQQMNYQRPIVNGYGDLRLVVGKNGMLLQLNSRIIPVFDLPAPAEINPQSIADKMMGREFKYANIAGQTLSYKVTQRSEVSVKDLVVYPKEEGRKITIHLAYAVEVGTGTTWTVYVDAINGQEIAVKQNFVS
ncbi:MAG: hypothetical protein ACREBD_24045 [Blastocatellia bacterium]